MNLYPLGACFHRQLSHGWCRRHYHKPYHYPAGWCRRATYVPRI